MDEKAESTFRAGVDKALVIALATPIAYLLAFQYDRGYLFFFGVPDTLVDVSLRDLLFAAAAAVSVAYTLYIFFDFVLTLLPERWPQRIQRRAIWLFWIGAALVLLLRVFDARMMIWIIALALIVTLSFFLVALPITRRINTSAHESTSEEPTQTDPYAHKSRRHEKEF
jgi:hypothetical protein